MTPVWWRTGDQTIKRLERDQARRAWLQQRYDTAELHAALSRLLTAQDRPAHQRT